jgi:tetratricopeptide (TPR) repeat protein
VDILNLVFLVVGIPATLVTAIYAHSTIRYARGDLAQQAGRYEDAVRFFRKAAQGRNPFGRGIAFAALGRVYLKMGKPQEALAALREAALRSKVPSVILAIYQVWADAAVHPSMNADREDALREAEKLVAATGMPKTMKAVSLGQLASAWYRIGNFAEASRAADQTLAYDALNASGLFTGGWLDLAHGNLSRARERFTALANLSNKDQKNLGTYGLGAVSFAEGNLAGAEEFFGKAAATSPVMLEPFVHARLSITRTLLEKDGYEPVKKAEAALADLQKRGAIRKESGAHWLVAKARAFAEGNSAAVKNAAEQAANDDRPEADSLAATFLSKKPAQGWLSVNA